MKAIRRRVPKRNPFTGVIRFGGSVALCRWAIIERLSRGPASVHKLTEPFALSQQMISKHIAYLVRARILIKTECARESVCTIRPEAIKTASNWAINYRRFWEESFDKLDVVVTQTKKEIKDGNQHG